MLLGILLLSFGVFMAYRFKVMVRNRTGNDIHLPKLIFTIICIPLVLFALIAGPLLLGSFLSSFKEKYWDNR
jgi:hypothetical protein